jgi:hypothetical protein
MPFGWWCGVKRWSNRSDAAKLRVKLARFHKTIVDILDSHARAGLSERASE